MPSQGESDGSGNSKCKIIPYLLQAFNPVQVLGETWMIVKANEISNDELKWRMIKMISEIKENHVKVSE
jgi:hypothetical protein